MTDSQTNSQPLSKDDEEMIEAIFSDLNPKNHPDLSDIFLVRKPLRRYRNKKSARRSLRTDFNKYIPNRF